jgi:short-subunit dehydrogenase
MARAPRVGPETVAIVTGASSGIGFATVRALARRGARVLAVARREERLRALVDACRSDSPETGHLAGDLGERNFAERCVAEAVTRYGRLDVLVNNHAIPKHKHALHTSVEEAERVLRINFLSCVWTAYAALPVLLAQPGGGVIVNVSSFAARVTPPREGFYAASKAALDAWSAGLWNDLAGSDIHVGLVIPGAIDTEIWEKEDEPPGFSGKKHPPEIVVRAILQVIEERRHEVVAPARDPSLVSASVLRRLAPGLLRRGMARMEPVPEALITAARERARRGVRIGEGHTPVPNREPR